MHNTYIRCYLCQRTSMYRLHVLRYDDFSETGFQLTNLLLYFPSQSIACIWHYLQLNDTHFHFAKKNHKLWPHFSQLHDNYDG